MTFGNDIVAIPFLFVYISWSFILDDQYWISVFPVAGKNYRSATAPLHCRYFACELLPGPEFVFPGISFFLCANLHDWAVVILSFDLRHVDLFGNKDDENALQDVAKLYQN